MWLLEPDEMFRVLRAFCLADDDDVFISLQLPSHNLLLHTHTSDVCSPHEE